MGTRMDEFSDQVNVKLFYFLMGSWHTITSIKKHFLEAICNSEELEYDRPYNGRSFRTKMLFTTSTST